MILLWGLPRDRPMAMVRDALQELDCPIFFLNQAEALETEAELTAHAEIHGVLRVSGRAIRFEDVRAVYLLRPYDSRRLPAVVQAGEGSSEWRHALNVEDILTSWVEMTSAFLINRLSSMASNNSKPYQA